MKRIIKSFFIATILFSLVSCATNATQTVNTKIEKTNVEQPKSDISSLNEVGKTGDYQLKTVGYKETNEILLSNDKFNTTNNYIIVDIEIAAIDKALEFGYGPDDFLLKDKEGKTYNACQITNNLNIDNEHKDTNYVGIFKPLNPNVFKKTQLVFEVPNDIEPISLLNKNNGSTDYVEFKLK